MSKLILKAKRLVQLKLPLTSHLRVLPLRLELKEMLRLKVRAVKTLLKVQLLKLLRLLLNSTLKNLRSLRLGKTILFHGLPLLVRT